MVARIASNVNLKKLRYLLIQCQQAPLYSYLYSPSSCRILAAARSEPKPDPKANKHHEPIRRILKRKVEKEEKLRTAKTVRQGNWKGAQDEDASTDEDTKDAEMAEAPEPVKVVREVKEASVEKKTRFTPIQTEGRWTYQFRPPPNRTQDAHSLIAGKTSQDCIPTHHSYILECFLFLIVFVT
jgi:hypothetical protein